MRVIVPRTDKGVGNSCITRLLNNVYIIIILARPLRLSRPLISLIRTSTIEASEVTVSPWSSRHTIILFYLLSTVEAILIDATKYSCISPLLHRLTNLKTTSSIHSGHSSRSKASECTLERKNTPRSKASNHRDTFNSTYHRNYLFTRRNQEMGDHRWFRGGATCARATIFPEWRATFRALRCFLSFFFFIRSLHLARGNAFRGRNFISTVVETTVGFRLGVGPRDMKEPRGPLSFRSDGERDPRAERRGGESYAARTEEEPYRG